MYNAPQTEYVALSVADVIATSGLGVGNDDSGLLGSETSKYGSLQSIQNRS